MEIEGETYRVTCDPTTHTVTFQGTLRLLEYDDIQQLLDDLVVASPDMVTLDLRALRFLNSCGLNLLFRFIIQMRDQTTSQVVIRGSAEIPWQTKTLRHLEKLMPSMQMELSF